MVWWSVTRGSLAPAGGLHRGRRASCVRAASGGGAGKGTSPSTQADPAGPDGPGRSLESSVFLTVPSFLLCLPGFLGLIPFLPAPAPANHVLLGLLLAHPSASSSRRPWGCGRAARDGPAAMCELVPCGRLTTQPWPARSRAPETASVPTSAQCRPALGPQEASESPFCDPEKGRN